MLCLSMAPQVPPVRSSTRPSSFHSADSVTPAPSHAHRRRRRWHAGTPPSAGCALPPFRQTGATAHRNPRAKSDHHHQPDCSPPPDHSPPPRHSPPPHCSHAPHHSSPPHHSPPPHRSLTPHHSLPPHRSPSPRHSLLPQLAREMSGQPHWAQSDVAELTLYVYAFESGFT